MLRIFNIEIQNKPFELIFNGDLTVRDFKEYIEDRFIFPVDRMVLSNVTVPINLTEGSCTLNQLNLLPEFVIQIEDTLNAWGINPIKILGRPRRGRKLIVLDIDNTICDPEAPDTSAPAYARPHLLDFLANVHKDYDIGLWSATPMEYIEAKVEALHLNNNPHFKILFYADFFAMSTTIIENRNIFVKPLQFIWTQFPLYNSKNTLACDDFYNSFRNNVDNGILVQPYHYQDYESDRELTKLERYLKSIFRNEDFSALDHYNWRQDQ